MTLKDLYTFAFSLALGSAVIFAVGYNSTLDAIIATLVWVMLITAMLALIAMTIAIYVVERTDMKTVDGQKALKPFYEALSKMHSGLPKRIISAVLTVYWLYGFVIHEWTATAVFYVIISLYGYAFIYSTKDLVKQFFIDCLKGETA